MFRNPIDDLIDRTAAAMHRVKEIRERAKAGRAALGTFVMYIADVPAPRRA